jgi:predicted NAD/FAD-dependent oxidoreductase
MHASSILNLLMSTTTSSSSIAPKCYNIAIVGGGITGTCAARTLLLHNQQGSSDNIRLKVHLFDQGQRGVGGRSSHRRVDGVDGDNDINNTMHWDHGCQFFRCDTNSTCGDGRFKTLVDELIAKKVVAEWKGTFTSSTGSDNNNNNNHNNRDFFGLPSQPPFYVGVGGMQNVPRGVLDLAQAAHAHHDSDTAESSDTDSHFQLFSGTRVANMERIIDNDNDDDNTKKWQLFGTSGKAAFHDTPEKEVVAMANKNNGNGNNDNGHNVNDNVIGNEEGYDAVLLTDVSSSFGGWHRASAGVPESFSRKVRDRVGARVPLLTAMVAFSEATDIPFDAATFQNDPTLWFASKTNSKPGFDNKDDNNVAIKECWMLVSTPEYAMDQIEETPMQDPKTGEFVPQSKDYLTTVPGPALLEAFMSNLQSQSSTTTESAALPKPCYMNAQRWGSAMPSPSNISTTTTNTQGVRNLSGVPYDTATGPNKAPLAPTRLEQNKCDDQQLSFLVDDSLMLYQAGDMMSTYTPGFEGAALSGMDAAEHLLKDIHTSHKE